MRAGKNLQFIGWLLAVLAAAMVIPSFGALTEGETDLAVAFGICALLTAFTGFGLIVTSRGSVSVFSLNEGLLLVVLSWVVVPVFAGLPLALADGIPTLLDAWFEAVSGLTTTGATLITDFEGTPIAIFLWRALLQWLGGLFVLLMAIHILAVIGATLLPVKQVKLPSPDFVEASEDLTGRIVNSVVAVVTIYVIMTFGVFLFLWGGAIPGWEAFCLSLSTMSTGGFTTRAGSFDAYGAPIAEAGVVLFMVLASMNFLIHWHGVRLRFREYNGVSELKFLSIIMVAMIWIVWAVMAIVDDGVSLGGVIFNVISLISTTGFYVTEGADLADLPPVLIMVPLMIGGAALSTTGGFKVVRFVLLIKHASREMKRLGHPHGLFPLRFGDYKISERTMDAVWALFLGFMTLTAVLAFVVGWAGFDFETALIAATAAVMNGGPFLEASNGGTVVWSDFPPLVRTMLAFGMIIGRVEVLAFLVVFNVNFWRR